MALIRHFNLFKERRQQLLQNIQKEQPGATGAVVLFAGFEQDCIAFRQERSFYYLTGIEEPGAACVISTDGTAHLYISNCYEERLKWVTSVITLKEDNAKHLGFDEIRVMGTPCSKHGLHPFSPQDQYENLLADLSAVVAKGGMLFSLNPTNEHQYVEQRVLISRLEQFDSALRGKFVDISPIVAHMRRVKDRTEIESLYKAIEITMLAQEAAARTIKPGISEAEVQASLEYMFTGSNAKSSFPSIVGSGKNSTILHYGVNDATIEPGDLVLVDIGAELDYYCGDLTRTYPASGTFTPRQREIYNIVLETQEYIAGIAKPGYYIFNKEQPEKSLHNLAVEFLKKKGYDKYFMHGIGHFLGMDVHDVGDDRRPLEAGDVITIEPGIYITEEKIGIRIEDNYWIVQDGVVCLSEHLPKTAEEVEAMVQGTLSYEEAEAKPESEEDYDHHDEHDGDETCC